MKNRIFLSSLLIILILICGCSQKNSNNSRNNNAVANKESVMNTESKDENTKKTINNTADNSSDTENKTNEDLICEDKHDFPHKIGTIEDARKIMGENLRIPSYIPEGLSMKSIEVPEEVTDKNEDVRITYKGDGEAFFILYIRPADPNNEPAANSQSITIGDVEGNIICTTSEPSENANRFSTSLNWQYNDLEYSMRTVRIDKETVIKIAESIIEDEIEIEIY